MLQHEDLPLSEILDDEHWQSAFDQHGVDFGKHPQVVFTPMLTLWALISQVFFKDENRSCKAAVDRIASWWATVKSRIVSSNTGAYCRARMKISFEVIREIALDIALRAESAFQEQTEREVQGKIHAVVANSQSIRQTGRILLVDGFTLTAADTPANQAVYPQNPSQKEGVGFPIIRGVSLISMVTGLLIGLELGPYAGKQSGETALLWKMLGQLKSGDTLVADGFYCTYWLIAACQRKGINIVMKNHDKRDDSPLGARRLDKHQRITVWNKPERPQWMTEQEYADLPEKVEIRLVDVIIDQVGFRSKKYTIATTILESDVYTRDWIANTYRSRWLVELDIRAIKCSLGMDVIRAKTPAMVQAEIWSCLLAYNLIRLKMLQTSSVKGRMPRTLSLTATLQLLATNWLLASAKLTFQLVELGIRTSCSEKVGHRPNRVEPRANKRRPKLLALLTMPRQTAILQLTRAA